MSNNNNNNSNIISNQNNNSFVNVGGVTREKLPIQDHNNPIPQQSSTFWSKLSCFKPFAMFAYCTPSTIYQKLPSFKSLSSNETVTQSALEETNNKREKLIKEAAGLKEHAEAHFALFKKNKKVTSKKNALNYMRQYKKAMLEVDHLEKQFNQLKDVNDSIKTNQHNIKVARALKAGGNQLKNSMPNVDKVEDIMLEVSEVMDDAYEINQQFQQGFTSMSFSNAEMDDDELLKELQDEYQINESNTIELNVSSYPEVPQYNFGDQQLVNNNNNNDPYTDQQNLQLLQN
jgi:hypothetical protein